MSIHIRVFCRSDRSITRQEIIDFILRGALIDKKPGFDPAPNSTEATNPAWHTLELQPASPGSGGVAPEPVVIERIIDKALMDAIKEEGLDELPKIKTETNRKAVEDLIRGTKQLFHFDLGDGPSEDVWEAIDAVEMLLARELDGVIEANEGFYDAQLQLLN